MNVYLAAVRSLHISHGLSNPLQPGLPLKQFTFDILSDIQAFITPTCDDDTVRWAAITSGHFPILSAGEFTVLSRDLFDPSSHLTCSDAR